MLSYESLLASPTPERGYIVQPQLFPVGGKLYIAAPEKHNKTFLAINAAINLASGTPLWGIPWAKIDRPYRVGYFDKELGQERFRRRLVSIPASVPPNKLFIQPREPTCLLSTPEGFLAISKLVEEFRLEVIILDPLYKFYPGARENDVEYMSKITQYIDTLADTYGVSTIVLHHLAKPSMVPKSGAQRMRGSSSLAADLDTYIELKRTSPVHHKTRVMRLDFVTRDEPVEPLWLKIMPEGNVEYAGTDDPSPAAKARRKKSGDEESE